MWEKGGCENINRWRRKEMARKNQQDIGCFEADTFGQGLIDDLEINSSRE